MPSVRFPTVDGRNLSGKKFALPHDFGAPLNLVFIAYQREQQQDVDSWKSAADQAKSAVPALGVWELPTLSLGNSLFRGFIDGGMRRGIPDSHQRDRTITLYLDKRSFNDALNIRTESAITVLLVKPSGDVVFRAEGPYTAASGAALSTALTGTHSAS